jgi:hypothetical protein
MAKRIARVDKNQPQIVAELRGLGYHVTHIHTVGAGVPDLIVSGLSSSGRILALLVEVKQRGGKLTDDEIDWHGKYFEDGPLVVAFDSDDVVEWFANN